MAKKVEKSGLEAYCMKCKAKVAVDKAENVTMKNGRGAVKGVCSKCGTTVFKIGGCC